MSTIHPATAILEEAINRLLRLDPESLTRLGDIESKVICIEIIRGDAKGPVFYCHPSEGGFRVRHECEREADVTISGSLPSFARLALGERAQGVFSKGPMQISGDLELGQQFQRILKEIDLDWEEALSRYTGDAAAYHLGRAARSLFAWRRAAHEKFAQDFAEFVREEAQVVPPRAHVERLMDEIDTLRNDVERLAARIGRIRQSRESSS